MRKIKNPYCEYYDHADCFLRGKNGICKGLSDTWFGNRDCPFYKSIKEEQVKESEDDVVPAAGRKL